jgi:hypothetical protein
MSDLSPLCAAQRTSASASGAMPKFQFEMSSGLFSNPAAIRRLPGVVIRSLPARSTMYPSPISRALCSAGITAGGSSTVVSPTLSSEANSSRVSFSDREAIIRVWPFSVVGAWSILLAFDAYCSMILESVNKSWLLSVALRPLFLKMRMPCKYPAQRQPVRTFNPQLKCRA